MIIEINKLHENAYGTDECIKQGICMIWEDVNSKYIEDNSEKNNFYTLSKIEIAD